MQVSRQAVQHQPRTSCPSAWLPSCTSSPPPMCSQIGSRLFLDWSWTGPGLVRRSGPGPGPGVGPGLGLGPGLGPGRSWTWPWWAWTCGSKPVVLDFWPWTGGPGPVALGMWSSVGSGLRAASLVLLGSERGLEMQASCSLRLDRGLELPRVSWIVLGLRVASLVLLRLDGASSCTLRVSSIGSGL